MKIISQVSEVNCERPCRLYDREETFSKVSPGHAIEKTIYVANGCDFTDISSGQYLIQFQTFVTPCEGMPYINCDSPIQLIGETQFEITDQFASN